MTRLVGILNLSPDSFAETRTDVSPEAVLNKAGAMITHGIAALDVGAESTRPGATPLAPAQECERLSPVLPALRRLTEKAGVLLSVDTRHAATADTALQHGVDWINDVSGFADSAMVQAIRSSACKLIVMHSLSVPASPAITLPAECNAAERVADDLRIRVEKIAEQGIAPDRIILDPGIGFGKTAEQSFALLRHLDTLRALGFPLMIGHSRKSFLKRISDKPVAERGGLTLLVSHYLIQEKVDFIRVHDTESHAELLRLAEMLRHP